MDAATCRRVFPALLGIVASTPWTTSHLAASKFRLDSAVRTRSSALGRSPTRPGATRGNMASSMGTLHCPCFSTRFRKVVTVWGSMWPGSSWPTRAFIAPGKAWRAHPIWTYFNRGNRAAAANPVFSNTSNNPTSPRFKAVCAQIATAVRSSSSQRSQRFVDAIVVSQCYAK